MKKSMFLRKSIVACLLVSALSAVSVKAQVALGAQNDPTYSSVSLNEKKISISYHQYGVVTSDNKVNLQQGQVLTIEGSLDQNQMSDYNFKSITAVLDPSDSDILTQISEPTQMDPNNNTFQFKAQKAGIVHIKFNLVLVPKNGGDNKELDNQAAISVKVH